jgi:hypothetical protein
MTEKTTGKKPEPSRAYAIRSGLTFFAMAFALWAVVSTATSFYAGVGSRFGYSKEQSVTADVQSCERRGPVSGDGIGYWTDCAAVVHTPDGRQAQVTLRHSIAGPADVGRTLTIREQCGNDNSGCTYGVPRNLAWGVLLRVLHMVEFLVVPALVLVGLIPFISAFLTRKGEYRFRVLLGRTVGKKPPPFE